MFSWTGNFLRDFFGTKVFVSYANDPEPTQGSESGARLDHADQASTETALALESATGASTSADAKRTAASPMDVLAEGIAYAIIERGLGVFFDKHNLDRGESFNPRIKRELESSSLFVFLITKKAVTPPNYTLTELKLAMSKWRNPSGRVLPVMVRETNINSVPQYLRTVQILKPVGNVAAEVGEDVARLIRRIRVGRLWRLVSVMGVLLLAAAAASAVFIGLPGGTFRIYEGYVLNDPGEVKSRDEAKSFENCLSLCQRKKNCNAFSYFPNGSCTLTDTYEQIEPRAGGRFGVDARLTQPLIIKTR